MFTTTFYHVWCLVVRGAAGQEVLKANSISNDDLISILFTATPDLQSDFPAAGVRELGLVDLPLICAQELDVKGSLPRTIRLLVHANSSLTRSEVTHKYLRGAVVLRPDLAAKADKTGIDLKIDGEK